MPYVKERIYNDIRSNLNCDYDVNVVKVNRIAFAIIIKHNISNIN